MPWVQPIGLEALEKVVARGQPDLDAGLLPRALDTMDYYRDALAPYPKCREAIRITQTDLQGPFDIAAQLWGSGIFTAFQDRPQFLEELLALIADTFARVSGAVGRRFDPGDRCGMHLPALRHLSRQLPGEGRLGDHAFAADL